MTWETLDPSISWNLGPGQARFFAADLEQEWTPVLLQIVGISPRQFATGEGLFGDNVAAKAEWQSWVRIPPLYTDLLPGLDERFNGLEYITALVKKEFFSLSDEVFKKVAPFVKQIALSPPLSRSSYAEPTPLKPLPTPVKRSKSGPPPGNVVVGIIDDGLAIGHERFRKSAGSTRIEYVWVQDGIPPSTLLTEGREIDKATIDAWLSASTHAGLVDEEEFYRQAGLADFAIARDLHRPVAWRRAHGTHVLDVATGAEPGGRPDWPIICVQLPIATVGMPETSTLGHYIIYGVWYILLRSLFVPGAALPVVINISYGISDGPHDGTHPIETAIEFIAGLWSAVFGVDVEVVIASGNSYLDRLHAEVTFPSAGSQTKDICWRVQPDDKTDSVVEIWLPYGPPATSNRLEVTLIAPDGSATTALGEIPGSLAEDWPPSGSPTLGQVAYGQSSAGRSHFRITVDPTAGIDSPGPFAPSGLWIIRLKNLALANGAVVHAYIARDHAPYGYPRRGRQSFFDDRLYERYDNAGRPIEVDNASIVKRAGSMNAMATGDKPSVIGGFFRKDRPPLEYRPVKYSAGGPIVSPGLPHRDGPDALAVSDNSAVHRGVLAAGTRSRSLVAMNGTSIAAPRITRWVAEQLANGLSGNRWAVQALAVIEEANPPLTGTPHPSPQRGGAGRIISLLPPPPPRPPRFDP